MLWGWDVLIVVEERAMDGDPGMKQARQKVMITQLTETYLHVR